MKVISSECISPQGHIFANDFELPMLKKKLRKDLLFVSPSQIFMDLTVQNVSQIFRFGDQWVNIVIEKNQYIVIL